MSKPPTNNQKDEKKEIIKTSNWVVKNKWLSLWVNKLEKNEENKPRVSRKK